MLVSPLAFVVLVGMPPIQQSQSPSRDTSAQVAHAAATITPAMVAAYRTALLADSMRGSTPSAAVDRAARYVAATLRSLGLPVPLTSDTASIDGYALGGDRYANGIHRYTVPGQFRVDYRRSVLKIFTIPHGQTAALIAENGARPSEHSSEIVLATAALILDTAVARRQISSFADIQAADAGVLIAGRHTLTSVRNVDVQRRTVVYVPPPQQDIAIQRAIVEDLAGRSSGVVVVSAADSGAFAAHQRIAQDRPPVMLPFARSAGSWAVEVWPGALTEALRLNGIDAMALRAITTPVVRPLPFMTADMQWSVMPIADTVAAPNVVAIVPGSDSSILGTRNYIVIQAGLDGLTHDGPEAATSVAGLLALAQAFIQPGAQPRRSLVFLITSGSMGQWGSRSFLSNGPGMTLPGFVLMLDLRHPSPASVLFVDGGQEVKAEPAPAWIAALHPELGITMTDTGSVLVNEAASVFTDRWLPTLVLRAGGGAASGGTDATAMARALQLAFYAIRALANADRLPQWTAVARQQLQASRP